MTLFNQTTSFESPRRRRRDDKLFAHSLCLSIFLPAVNNFLNYWLQYGLGLSFSLLTPFCYIFMAAISMLAVAKSWNHSKGLFCASAVILIGVFISYIIYPDIRSVIYGEPWDLVYNPINKIIFYSIPALFAASSLRDYERFFRYAQTWSVITITIGATMLFVVAVLKSHTVQYMAFSYFLLTPVCLCFESFWARTQKVQWHDIVLLILAMLGSFAMLLCGARGAIFCLAAFLLLRGVMVGIQKKKFVQLTFLLILTAVAGYFILFNQTVLPFIVKWLETLGLESRFLSSLLEGSLTESSGREQITRAIFDGMSKNPFGYGFFGDRYVTGAFGYSSYTYAHNIVLELVCCFGIIIGPLLFIFLIFHTIKGAFAKNIILRRLFWAFLPFGLFQLFFSSSFIENLMFYILCGLLSGRTENS